MEYHLCSQAVIDHLTPQEVSKPIFTGYESRGGNYYVAFLDQEDAETYFDEVIDPYNEKSRVHLDFWFRPCDPGNFDVDEITQKACRTKGLFRAIEEGTGLTTEKNIALAICNLAEKFNCSPVEFVNKVTPNA
jgi:hypothetical protein